MADSIGQSHDPIGLESDLETQIASFEFYAALRRVECAHAHGPRLGKSARASDDAVRLGQVPSLAFEPSMLVEAQRGADGRLRLGGVFFGLFGPNGPLPLHITEYAHDRRHNFRDPTFARFADVFHHRLLCLFYRAWADAQPTVQLDRPTSDRFRMYVGALAGAGLKAVRDGDAMPEYSKLYHAGRLSAQVKNPEALCEILQDFFRERVQIREFQAEWLRLCAADQLHLGRSAFAGLLGESTTLGERVWSAQSRFRVMLGPMSRKAFERFLPGSPALGQLSAIVRNCVGFELEWDLQLIVDRTEVPEVQLGRGARLGWTSWLGMRRRIRDADEVVLTAKA